MLCLTVPWNGLLLVQSKRKPNETQVDPPPLLIFSISFWIFIVLLKYSPSPLHLGALLFTDPVSFSIRIYAYYKIHPFNIYSYLEFRIFSRWFIHHHYLNAEHFDSSSKKHTYIYHSSLPLPLPHTHSSH